jgi:hypothetical protein
MSDAGLPPDPWQAKVLTSASNRILLLCSRQAGKSETAASLALRTALLEPPSLVLILSPTLRQSGELFRQKLLEQWYRLGKPEMAKPPTALELVLRNGSRIVSLPENEKGIRGFSGVSLLIIDEASRVDDALYHAVRPMLARSHGRLVALSTPFGQRGWFYEAWSGDEEWERVKITAYQCPHITPEFLAEERASNGERWFAQEYLCSFEASVDAVFDPAITRAAVKPGEALFG